MASRARLTGTVSAFDDAVGLGEVTSGDGEVHPFHCTRIADGSRTIALGAPVSYVVVAGHRGEWEAADLRPAP